MDRRMDGRMQDGQIGGYMVYKVGWLMAREETMGELLNEWINILKLDSWNKGQSMGLILFITCF